MSVKDGWEPLCKALDVPVPEGVPYPNLNDGESFEKVFKDLAIIGLWRWAAVFSVVAVLTAGAVWWLWR